MVDIANDRSTATELTAGSPVDSDITERDIDVVRIDLLAGQRYVFDLRGTSGDAAFTLADPLLTLLDPDGGIVAFDDDGGAGLDARIDYTAPLSGTFFAVAGAVSGAGSYRLSVASAPAATDAQGQAADTAGTIAIGGEVAGLIDFGGDQDWFRVALAAGSTYRFALRGDPGSASTLSDPILSVFAADGTAIASNDDASDATLDSALLFTPQSSGTYYLAAAGYYQSNGGYLLSAALGDPDIAGTADTTATLAISATIQSAIESAADADAIRIELSAGQYYEIAMTGATAGSGLSLAGPAFRILDAASGVVADSGSADGAAIAQVGFTATASGTYYVVASGVDGSIGSYSVSIQATVPPPIDDGVSDDGLASSRAISDFDGDGYADILWRHADGAVSSWSGTADGVTRNTFFAGVDSRWHVVETFDMNGDGRSDILWRNVDGSVAAWQANDAADSTAFAQASYFTGSPGGSWQIAATGDVDGDGRDDILWRDGDGAISLWSSTGSGFSQNSYFHGAVGSSWKVIGLADFNADGKDDLLWRNDNGAVSTWTSTGSGFAENSYFDASVDPSWHIDGLADLDGDGAADIVWRNDGGALSTWHAEGAGFAKNQYFAGDVGNAWQIAQTGDFNGDGRADLLWQNDGGAISVWSSNGDGFDRNTLYDAGPPTIWQIQSHDFLL